MREHYERSVEVLKLYMKITKQRPSERQWNKYARIENLLSRKSIEYLSGIKFNKMCRKLIKKNR